MSMAGRMVVVTDAAVSDAVAHGVAGDVRARVSRMFTRSAPYTCDFGNRRYEDFVLDVWDGRVLAVRKIDPVTGERVFAPHEVTSALEGWGAGDR